MDSYSEMEQSQVSEVDMLRDQLETYQALNLDLSKKIQEFKIALNAANKELLTTRNELMSEKLKSSELRRCLLIMNGQCTQFFNNYCINMEKCVESTDLEVTLPGAPTQSPAPVPAGFSQAAMIFQPHVKNLPLMADNNRTNMLHTICEETSDDSRFSGRHSQLVASTPFTETRALRDIQNLPPKVSENPAKDDSNNNMSLTPRRSNSVSRISIRRISEEENSETDDTILPAPEKSPTPNFQEASVSGLEAVTQRKGSNVLRDSNSEHEPDVNRDSNKTSSSEVEQSINVPNNDEESAVARVTSRKGRGRGRVLNETATSTDVEESQRKTQSPSESELEVESQSTYKSAKSGRNDVSSSEDSEEEEEHVLANKKKPQRRRVLLDTRSVTSTPSAKPSKAKYSFTESDDEKLNQLKNNKKLLANHLDESSSEENEAATSCDQINSPMRFVKSCSVKVDKAVFTESQFDIFLELSDAKVPDPPISTASSTVYDSTDSQGSSKPPRKKRVKAEPVPRRSTGRPKRKTRVIASLAEKSLHTKMRRSK